MRWTALLSAYSLGLTHSTYGKLYVPHPRQPHHNPCPPGASVEPSSRSSCSALPSSLPAQGEDLGPRTIGHTSCSNEWTTSKSHSGNWPRSTSARNCTLHSSILPVTFPASLSPSVFLDVPSGAIWSAACALVSRPAHARHHFWYSVRPLHSRVIATSGIQLALAPCRLAYLRRRL